MDIIKTSQPQADHVLENKELRQILQTALSKIPKKQRIAFLLHNHDGQSYKDIAEIMNTTHSAVESLIFRAKTNLRGLLKEYYKKYFVSTQENEIIFV